MSEKPADGYGEGGGGVSTSSPEPQTPAPEDTSILDKAEATVERLEQATAKAEAVVKRQEELRVKDMLGGEGEIEQEPQEDSPAEYAEKVIRGDFNVKTEE